MARSRPALCAGCRNFRVTSGHFRYVCLLWGIKSPNYDLAQVVHQSLGHPCPFCQTGPAKADDPKEPPPHQPDPDRVIDVKI